MRTLAVALLRWLAEALVRLYYPRRTVEGAVHLPPTGPALYVANHPNGLLDPLVLRVCTGHRVRFLAKSTLWGNPFGRLAMDAFGCLPVYRQQDVKTDDRGNSVARNEETFARSRAELAAGAELALYPEGTSHSDPRLKPLKSGAARIILSAGAEAVALTSAHTSAHTIAARALPATASPRPTLPMLVPVGSHYEDKSAFRSGVHLVVGEPIDYTALVHLFREDPRRAIDQLTEKIRARLAELVLEAETRELLAGIARVASWTAATPDDDAPAPHLARTRELLDAYRRLRAKDPARLEQVAREARRYARTLERLGVADPWTLETPRVSAGEVGMAIARVVATFPVALWGWVTSALPYRASGLLAKRMTKDEDVLSTIKMILGTTVLVAAWLLEAVIIGVLCGWMWGVASGLFAPVAGYAALRLAETVHALSEAVRHVSWRTHPKVGSQLMDRRRRLAEQVAQALREAGS